jgi:hypothetical protein
MDKRVAMIGGMGLGAGLMFLLDPNLGRRRRHIIGDKARALANDAEYSVGKKSRHLRNHAVGLVAEARSRLHEEVVDDRTLVERVRAELGRATRYPRAIDVEAENGVVVLTGPVLAADKPAILATAASVRGVEEVVSGLESHETADSVPSLQGARETADASAAPIRGDGEVAPS